MTKHVATNYRWSITYGGDEPLTHPFYERFLKALCEQDESLTYGGILCDIKTQEIVDGVEYVTEWHGVPVDYADGRLGFRLVQDDQLDDGLFVIHAHKIVHIHIC